MTMFQNGVVSVWAFFFFSGIFFAVLENKDSYKIFSNIFASITASGCIATLIFYIGCLLNNLF